MNETITISVEEYNELKEAKAEYNDLMEIVFDNVRRYAHRVHEIERLYEDAKNGLVTDHWSIETQLFAWAVRNYPTLTAVEIKNRRKGFKA